MIANSEAHVVTLGLCGGVVNSIIGLKDTTNHCLHVIRVGKNLFTSTPTSVVTQYLNFDTKGSTDFPGTNLTLLTKQQAQGWCQKLKNEKFIEYDSWRLPTEDELNNLAESGVSKYFWSTQNNYLSKTSCSSNSNANTSVSLDEHQSGNTANVDKYFVSCVSTTE